MCPELDFGQASRSLITLYRLAPELSERQLSAILKRYFSARDRERRTERQIERKGGETG